jgi:hypothetical protein
MFGYLPEAVQQQVIYYLQNDNFTAAKQLYDTWLNNSESQASPSNTPC